MIFRIGKLCGRRSKSWKPKLSARDRLQMGRRVLVVHIVKSSNGKGAWRNTIRVDQGSTTRCRSPKNEGSRSGQQSGKRGVHLRGNQAAEGGPHSGDEGGNGGPSQS